MQEEHNNSLLIGSKLEEFEILSVLGAGGFGITYKVRDTNLDTIMVIKEYMPNSFASRGNNNTTVTCISTNNDMFEWGMERFLEEAKILRKFDHISIVKTHRVFKANNTAYFVMDFYEGETLDNYLKRYKDKKFTQEEILSVMMPIIEGLKAVHNQGFLHRDISPDNIFLRVTKPPVLIDFGASRNALGVQSQNISAIIKIGYSPPEQYTSNTKQNETTDLYAISAVIYQMITGEKPPESTHRQSEVFNGDEDPIEDIVTKYQDRFEESFLETIIKGLSLRQKDRIQSIQEFQEGLVGDNNTPLPPKEPTPKSTPPIENNSNNLLKIIIGLLVVIIIGGGAFYYINVVQEKQKEAQRLAKELADMKEKQKKEEEIAKIAQEKQKKEAEIKRVEKEKRNKEEADRVAKERSEKLKAKQLKEDRLKEIFTKSKVRNFLSKVINLESQNDIDDILKFFDTPLSQYFNISDASYSTIFKDKKRYFKKWTTRANSLDFIKITNRYEQSGEYYADIEYKVYWSIENNERKKSGIAINKIRVKKYGLDSFKIISIKTLSQRTDTDEVISKYKFEHFSDNGIDIEFKYPSWVKAGEHFIVKVKMTNRSFNSAKKGGLTLSFPDMVSLKGIKESNNFSTLTSYTTGDKIYNQDLRRAIPAKYFMIEGWQSQRWRVGSSKYFSIALVAPYGLNKLRINLRGILWITSSRNTRKIPQYSNVYDQQGFAVKQLNIQIN